MELNLFAIFAAALLSLAIGTIWYSPFVCGPQWKKALGLAVDAEPTPAQVVTQLITGGAMQILFFGSLATVLALLKVHDEASLRTVLLSCVLMVLAVIARFSIFEKRPASLFFINSTYAVLSLVAGGYVIMYWPW